MNALQLSNSLTPYKISTCISITSSVSCDFWGSVDLVRKLVEGKFSSLSLDEDLLLSWWWPRRFLLDVFFCFISSIEESFLLPRGFLSTDDSSRISTDDSSRISIEESTFFLFFFFPLQDNSKLIFLKFLKKNIQ